MTTSYLRAVLRKIVKRWRLILFIVILTTIGLFTMMFLDASCKFESLDGRWISLYSPGKICNIQISILQSPLRQVYPGVFNPIKYSSEENCLKQFDYSVKTTAHDSCGVIYRDYTEDEFTLIHATDACWLISTSPQGNRILSSGWSDYQKYIHSTEIRCLCERGGESDAQDYVAKNNLGEEDIREGELCDK